jgi:hypothetical protein
MGGDRGSDDNHESIIRFLEIEVVAMIVCLRALQSEAIVKNKRQNLNKLQNLPIYRTFMIGDNHQQSTDHQSDDHRVLRNDQKSFIIVMMRNYI